jgi:hypothetical protein
MDITLLIVSAFGLSAAVWALLVPERLPKVHHQASTRNAVLIIGFVCFVGFGVFGYWRIKQGTPPRLPDDANQSQFFSSGYMSGSLQPTSSTTDPQSSSFQSTYSPQSAASVQGDQSSTDPQ